MQLHHACKTFLNDRRGRCRIVTLGPTGTSSEFAARHVAEKLNVGIALFTTYEGAAEYLVKEECNSVLLVANAYIGINRFYISHAIQPAAALFFDTPPYVLASRNPDIMSHENLRIASHSAPSHLLRELLPSKQIYIEHVSSTAHAAQKTASGEYDACLTTLPACKDADLHILVQAMTSIPMLWTLFICREQ